MIDCKSCGMQYDHDEFKLCPYCGHDPKKDENDGSNSLEAPKAEQTELLQKEKKPANILKLVLIVVAILVVVAIAVYALFTQGDSSITVPDRYATIQEAIDAAEDGEEIVVQVGVYRENIDFKGKNIILRSVDPDDPDIVAATIIDGRGSGTVVAFRSGEGEGAILSGFTITRGSGVLISGGSTPRIEKNIIEDNSAEFGAGIAIFDSNPTIVGNTIIRNSGFLGGGLFIEGSSPLIENNIISNNRAEMGSGMVIITNSAPQVVNNTISDNVAARLGGGIVIAVDSTPNINGNTIANNSAERNGGGILIEESEPVIENNIIIENRSANGGAIFVVNSSNAALLIKNNEITDNVAFIAGGGLFMEGSSPTVEGNTFLNNRSEYLGGGAAAYNSTLIFIRNIFENNQAGEIEGGGAIWISADSIIEISEPDNNTYLRNIPDDLFLEEEMQ